MHSTRAKQFSLSSSLDVVHKFLTSRMKHDYVVDDFSECVEKPQYILLIIQYKAQKLVSLTIIMLWRVFFYLRTIAIFQRYGAFAIYIAIRAMIYILERITHVMKVQRSQAIFLSLYSPFVKKKA